MIVRVLLPLLVLPILAMTGYAQPIPPFSQNFTHPTGLGSTSLLNYNISALDTSITFQPLAPPDNDWGIAPITTSMQFSGQTLHWALILDLDDPLFRNHNYSPTNACNAVFRLYGVALGDTAIVKVRVISVVTTVGGNNGLTRGRVALTTNMGADAQDFTHFMGGGPASNTDTLIVPVRVLGNNQFLQFQLSMLNHIEMLDSSAPRQDVVADVSFLDVPAGMSVVNAYGYGSVVLDVPEVGRAGALRARARVDGRQVVFAGVAPGGAELEVFDLVGRRLAGGHVMASARGEAELSLPAPLASGVFFVRCRDAGGARSTRFAFAR